MAAYKEPQPVDWLDVSCYTGAMAYMVVVHESKYGYGIHCPALPGCHSQGAMVRKETRGQRTRRVLVPA